MTYIVTIPFRGKSGHPVPAGTKLKLTDQQAAKLSGYIIPMAQGVATDSLVTFEPTGDPTPCPYWFRVCWAVGLYQEQCTRDTECRVYKFLHKQGEQSQ